MFVTLTNKDDMLNDSEVGWISNTKLLLTVSNELFLVNIDSS